MPVLCKTGQKRGWDSYRGALAIEETLPVEPAAGPIAVEELEQSNWYALQTRYHAERQVQRQLCKKGFQTFVPVVEEVRRWSDRQKRIQIPLFSGYTFVHTSLSLEARARVLQTTGVLRFLSFAGEVMPVPTRQIEDLQRLLQHKVPCSLHAFLKVGRRVRIRGGCLDGLEGILEQSGEKKLVISIDCIERSLAVQIAGYELELA